MTPLQSPSTSGSCPPGNARDLTRFVRVYDDALDTGFCNRMIESFEQLSTRHERSGRGRMPSLESSAWTELNLSRAGDVSLERFFRERVIVGLERYNKDLGLALEVPLRARMEDFRIKRYSTTEDDQFQPHFDALDYTCNRYLVFLWYLNDVEEGGETEFADLGLKIAPKTGRLIVFPPYWMFQHAGLPPRSNDKYILSTYLLF